MGRAWPCRGSCAQLSERGDEDVAGEGDLEGVVAEGLRLGELGLRGRGEAVGAGGGALERALGGVGAPRRVGDAAEGDARVADGAVLEVEGDGDGDDRERERRSVADLAVGGGRGGGVLPRGPGG